MPRPSFIPLAITFLMAGTMAYGQQRATRDQALALVKEAVAVAKAKGRDELFKQTSFGSGRFHVKEGGDLYIFIYDMAGVVLAHGAQANVVGMNRMNSKDPAGKEYIKEIVAVGTSKTKSAWVSYQYPDPKTKKVEDKVAYCEYYDGMVIGAGIYKAQ